MSAVIKTGRGAKWNPLRQSLDALIVGQVHERQIPGRQTHWNTMTIVYQFARASGKKFSTHYRVEARGGVLDITRVS